MERKSDRLATLTRPRERVLEVILRWLSLAAPPIWATLIAQAVREDISFPFIFCLLAVTSPMPAVYLLRERLGYVLTTKLCLLFLFLTILYVEAFLGFTATTALMCIFALLLATLLLGDKAFPRVLVASVVILGLGWLLYSAGIQPRNAERLVDPRSPFVWIRFGLALGFLGGAVRDWAWSVRSLGHEELLNELGCVLASSLDAEQTLREVSRRVVQHFADICVVDLIQVGQLKRVYVATRDPARAPLADALESVPIEQNDSSLAGSVVRTGRPKLTKVARLMAHSEGAEHRAWLKGFGARSMISAPVITSGGEMLGVLTAASASRVYDQQDLDFFSNVADRAAMAIENASLHANLQRAHDEIESQLRALEEASQKIRTLTGLLPICAWCGRIRDERKQGQWLHFDEFVTNHTSAEVTHGICPDCAARVQSDPGDGAERTLASRRR